MNTMPRKKGFTLVETMVAVAILAIALVGPYTAVQNALSASYIARDELVASSLAQEGMEYIRSIRDNNYLNGRTTWLDELSSYSCYGATPTQYCTVDPSQGDIHTDTSDRAMTSYSSLAVVPVLYLSSNNIYNQQLSGTATRFKRSVQITTISPTEVRVVVVVSWTTVRQSYSVTVTDNLQDWL